MAEFDRVILPGGEGKIRLQVKTEGYQGNLTRTAMVYTNDPGKKRAIIKIKVYVQASIVISPRYVSLYGQQGKNIVKIVDIRAGLERPLSLTPTHSSLSEKVRYKLDEIEEGRRFRIRIENTSDFVGTFYGFLKFKTNYPEKPEITIRIKGKFVEKKKGSKPESAS